jgi:4-diphosphocytidyl-2-C-methyl-D-erythritol kinase
MSSMELKAHAKINLSLDVTEKRSDGYHNLRMIMQTIALYDSVFLEEIPSGIEVLCDHKWAPSGNENIAFKAAEHLFNEYKIKRGIKIKIDKRIPVAAGLAGGSSDAASVLKGINSLFKLDLDDNVLMGLGKKIGADVPYCIKGGTMLAEGIGDILTELPHLEKLDIVLVKPRIGVSTPWVYKNLNLGKIIKRPDTELLLDAIKNKRLDILGENMGNVLETVTIPKHPIIQEIKLKMVELGALGSMMSGSGPSVFGIFKDLASAQNAYNKIKCDRWDSFLTVTV